MSPICDGSSCLSILTLHNITMPEKDHSHAIAKILRVDKDVLLNIETKLGARTGKKNILDKIAEENELIVLDRLKALNLESTASAKDIYGGLIEKIKGDDMKLFSGLGKPLATNPEDWKKVLAIAMRLVNPQKGLFMKLEKAKEFLINKPPQNVMKALGYSDVRTMLEKEDIFEVYSALRFIEGSEWLNTVFFNQYKELTPADFEYREITVRALPKRWQELAETYVRKKYHNISHLKELGVLFVIPLAINVPGETIRNFSLILHYLYEIPFYAKLFERFAKEETLFSERFISLLRGDVVDARLPEEESKVNWLVVQRYLAKDDEYDWRLFEPRVNPEARHWTKAEDAVIRAGDMLDGFSVDLEFWRGLNWVGKYFKDESGVDTLASFNLVDTAMSLVMQKSQIKYLYHHQEALWNKIFIEYFGVEELERLTEENIVKGWFRT